jgi:murein DD-endopeptidase MepM/ murein hydrolase activator NlpD
MRRLLLVALLALATAGAAGADTFTVVPQAPAPFSAETPNAGEVVVPLELGMAPAQPEQLSVADLQQLWVGAGQQYGIPWQVLGAINKIESNFGQNMGPSTAGAVGWMQFMPGTWLRWGTDADGDGVADPWNPRDAIYSAARYLAAAGGQTDIQQAIFSYNHAQWYVDEVLQLATAYAGGGPTGAQGLQDLQQQLKDAQQAVVDTNAALLDATAAEESLTHRENELLVRATSASLLSDQLTAQKDAGQLDLDREQAHAATEQARTALADAQAALDAARSASQAPSFGTSTLFAGPSYGSGYVFPVGGGAGVVSVGLTHHDYPAADIAAPAGSPVYALGDAAVLQAWHAPEGACGIGVTLQTTDGLTWTYCHLAYLEPTVETGIRLAAGAPVGLVGDTGHAEGPHLHLQLQPANAYPQDEEWFKSFAGTAFSWQQGSQANAAAAPLFAVVSDSGAGPAPAGSVVLFHA